MRDRRLLASAVGISALGDFLGFIPLALHVQERTGSGIAVAGLFIALWAPSVVLGGPAGLLADRVESRRLLRDVSLGQAAIAAVLALTFGGLAATLALTALLGVGVALAQPAEFALVPAAAGPDGVAAANGRIEAARYLGFTLGPVLGGLLAAAGGTRIALLVNAASFLVVALAAQALRARREPQGSDRSGETNAGARLRREPAAGSPTRSCRLRHPSRARRHRLPAQRRRAGAGRGRRLRLAHVHDRVGHRRGLLRQGRPARRRHRLRRAHDAVDGGHGDRLDPRRLARAGDRLRDGGAGGHGAAGRRAGAAHAVAGPPLRARRLPGGRRRPWDEERPRAHAHPRARARRAARPRLGRLQRRAQRGGADRARRRRPARVGHRRALDAAGRGRAAGGGRRDRPRARAAVAPSRCGGRPARASTRQSKTTRRSRGRWCKIAR